MTAPGGRRSLLGMLARDLSERARRRGRQSRVAALIGDHLLTVAAFTVADVTLWHTVGTLAGGLSVFASLLVIDYKLRG